jgi:hypothetical protein
MLEFPVPANRWEVELSPFGIQLVYDRNCLSILFGSPTPVALGVLVVSCSSHHAFDKNHMNMPSQESALEVQMILGR